MTTAYPTFEAAAFVSAEQGFASLIGRLRGAAAMVLDHGQVEELIRTDGLEVLRRLYQGHLDLRAITEPRVAVEGADSVVRTHRRDTQRKLESIFGTVIAHRQAWSARGHESLHPLDGQLNLPVDSFTHGVERRVCEEAISVSFDRTSEVVTNTTGAMVAKRQCEQLVVKAAADFESFYASTTPRPDRETDLLALTFDGKGIVMRFASLRPATQKAALKAARKLTKRLSKGEKPNRKRMATVASVYALAAVPRTPAEVVGEANSVPVAKRPRATNKRVWASLSRSPEDVIEEAFVEAEGRDPEHRRRWVVPVDGNEDQIAYAKAAARRHKVDVTLVLDIVHVIEYLWKAAWSLHPEGDKAAQEWVSERLLKVLQGKASAVAGGMRRSATLRGLDDDQRKPIDKAAGYLTKYPEMVRYNRFLADGLPIATGVIEGACRHLVKDRMDITGARWGLEGAEAVLRLRALHSSGDLDDYFQFHHDLELDRNHLAHYADGALKLAA